MLAVEPDGQCDLSRCPRSVSIHSCEIAIPDVKHEIDPAANREGASCTNWGKEQPKLDESESSKSDRDVDRYIPQSQQ